MKSILNWVAFSLIFILIILIAFFYIKDILIIKTLQNKNTELSDSLNKKYFENVYLSQLIWLNSKNADISLPNKIYAYEMSDKSQKHPVDLNALLSIGKKKLIIRYTQIGCNACTDSAFSLIRKNTRILKEYEILVLVDFTNYEYYIKWRKISEINEKVLLLEKSRLPFPIDKEDLSYLFVIDSAKKASSFFIPKSKFTDYLKQYLETL